ncbi:MAG: OmpH family outer membrane protein [bacterium]
MKISKKLMGLLAAACFISATVRAGTMMLPARSSQGFEESKGLVGSIVTIDAQRLLQESEGGLALKARLENGARELQEQQQNFVAELQKAAKELQTKSKLMSKTAQEQEIARLQKMEKRAQRTMQENAEEFQASAKMEQELLHRHHLSVAAAMREEHGWLAVFEKQALVAASPDIEVTNLVLAELNKQYLNSQPSSQILFAQADAAQPEEGTATA